MKTLLILCAAAITIPAIGLAYEKAFEATDAGTIEMKTIPERTLIVAQNQGTYFDENNQLFGQLFRYIQDNDIAMTTPVKADINPAKMYFYVGSESLGKDLKNTDRVKVITEPAYNVLSIGVRGGYGDRNYKEARDQLLDELAVSKEWRKSGDAYAIYWDGPYLPGFMKRFEVHVPITSLPKNEKAPAE